MADMFEGPNDCLYSAITVCSMLGLIALGIAGLIKQELEIRKLDRRWNVIMRRNGGG